MICFGSDLMTTVPIATRMNRRLSVFHRQNQSGYTLIEILIVLFIISIVTSVALLSISRNEGKQMETLANELVQQISLAEEQAMLQPSVLGLSLQDGQLQFSRLRQNESGHSSDWELMQESAFRQRRLPDAFQVRVSGYTAQEESEKKVPQIIISTNGDLTPFTIYIGKKGQKPRYAVKGDADGNVVSESLS